MRAGSHDLVAHSTWLAEGFFLIECMVSSCEGEKNVLTQKYPRKGAGGL